LEKLENNFHFCKKKRMKLYLVRHGKTEAFADSDKLRNLLSRGMAQAKGIGALFLNQNEIFDQIFCSNANRTKQTLDQIQNQFSCSTDVNYSSNLYLCSSTDLLRFLSENVKESSSKVLLIGHNDGISDLATFLSGQFVSLKTGSLIILDLKNTKINLVDEGCATITDQFRAEA
jgi:phosphohistidine phosphatase